MAGPMCFVLMPFGKKADAAGKVIDFDAVYHDLIGPAIEDALMRPLRADEELRGGIIHKPMFERLIVCDFAVADLTTANANVFYELGVRHALRPASTVLLRGGDSRMPFDVGPLRAITYELSATGKPKGTSKTRALITQFLNEARQATIDSPVFDLLTWLKAPVIDRALATSFQDALQAAEIAKESIASASANGVEALRSVAASLGDVHNQDGNVVLALFIAYRDMRAFKDMVELFARMSPALRAAPFVREQYALALNREGEGEKAEQVLKLLLRERGPSPETLGILGRVYKDRWTAARRSGNTTLSNVLLRRALDTYVEGFEADCREHYPGINALTLWEWVDPADPRRAQILPVVRYAVERSLVAAPTDYWSCASSLELAVLARDRHAAEVALGQALAAAPKSFMVDTTLNNLVLIREARSLQGASDDVEWITQIAQQLRQAVPEPAASH